MGSDDPRVCFVYAVQGLYTVYDSRLIKFTGCRLHAIPLRVEVKPQTQSSVPFPQGPRTQIARF